MHEEAGLEDVLCPFNLSICNIVTKTHPVVKGCEVRGSRGGWSYGEKEEEGGREREREIKINV